MRRTIAFFFALLLASATGARADEAAAIPRWVTFGGGPSSYAFALDPAQRRSGGPSLRIAALAPSSDEFGASAWSLDATPYRGKRVRLAGEVFLVARLFADHPTFGQIDYAPGSIPTMFDLSGLGVAGALSDASLASPIKAFHLTNPIARASVTMAECAALASGAAKMAAE